MTFSHTAALMATAFCAANAQTVGLENVGANRGGAAATPVAPVPVAGATPPVAQPATGLAALVAQGTVAPGFAPRGQVATLTPGALGALGVAATVPGGLPCAAPFLVTSFDNLAEFNPAAPLVFGGGLVIEFTLLLNQLTPGANIFEFSENPNPRLSNGVVAQFSDRGDAIVFKTFDEDGNEFAQQAVEASRVAINRETMVTIVVKELDPLAARPNVNGAELFIMFNGVEVATSLITAPAVVTRMVNLIGPLPVEGQPIMDGLVTDFTLQACEPSLANAAALGLAGGKKDDDVATDEVVTFLIIAVVVLIILVAGILVYLVCQPSRAAAAPAKTASSSERSSSRRSSSRRSSSRRSKSKSEAVSV